MKEREIILNYLPAQAKESDVKDFILKTISETKSTSVKDMKNVVPLVQEKFKGSFDPKLVGKLVKEEFQKLEKKD